MNNCLKLRKGLILGLISLLSLQLIFSFGFIYRERPAIAHVSSHFASTVLNTNNLIGSYLLGEDLYPALKPVKTDIPSSVAGSVTSTLKEWTIMAYLAGDNDLHDVALDDLNEMEFAGSDDNINIIALLDRQNNPDTKLYYVCQDKPSNPEIISQIITNSPFDPEINTGCSSNLLNFAKWTIDNFPAKRYVLLLWGHGLGWRGVAHDYSSSNDSLSPSEIEEALLSVKELVGFQIDVVVFDACLMQMSEVAASLGTRQLAGLMVGSQETVPGGGLDYGKIFSLLKSNPGQSSEDWVSGIVDKYLYSYPEEKVTLSAIRLEKINELTANLDSLAYTLLQSGEWIAISDARSQSEYFSDQAYIDLYDFVEKLQSSVNNTSLLLEAKKMQSYLDQAILKNGNNNTHPEIHGVSIYFPYSGNMDPSYCEQIVEITGWARFLIQYLNNCSAGNCD